MFWQEMDLDLLNLEDLEDLAALWLNTNRRVVAPKTTGRRLTAMKNLGLAYKQAVLIDYSPPTAAQPKPHPLPGGFADLQKLLDSCHQEEHRTVIALTGLVGARISEAREIQASSFNMHDKTVRIWGKGDKERVVPVSDMAWRILMPTLVDRLTTGHGDVPLVSMGDRTARELITRLGVRARINRSISSHDLRATFATEAYRRTKDIRAVQVLLGHASSKQTELYILVEDDAMRAAANFMET
jgi:integrase